MKAYKRLLLASALAAAAPLTVQPWAATAARCTVTVVATGFSCDAGVARIAVFSGEDGFPDGFALAYKSADVEILNGEARAVFTDVEYGTYAVAVLHDGNRNGVWDRNFFKVPLEGFGVSRGAPAMRARPRFEDCVIGLYAEEVKVEVAMQN